MKKKHIIIIISTLLAVLLCGVILNSLVWRGYFILNSFNVTKYPVRGIDVSHYQGEIDWDTLARADISFAFIKATEGSSYVDDRFAYNYTEAIKTDLAIGAYHFFSFDSAGKTQAESFIKTVPPHDGMLPPVIDLEFYGGKHVNPPARDDVQRELDDMLDALEAHYGLKPIIYVTEETYEAYIAGEYEGYDIWIRNVKTKPHLSDGRAWTMWQYTNRERLTGYSGEEEFIDMNVFAGSEADWREYVEKNTYKTNP